MYLYSLFWENLCPVKDSIELENSGLSIEKYIVARFGSVSSFKDQFNSTGAGVQGSGWAVIIVIVINDSD